MNKFLHQPLQMLKAAAREGDAARIDAIRAAFQRESRNGHSEAASPEPEPSLDGAEPDSGETKSLLSKS